MSKIFRALHKIFAPQMTQKYPKTAHFTVFLKYAITILIFNVEQNELYIRNQGDVLHKNMLFQSCLKKYIYF